MDTGGERVSLPADGGVSPSARSPLSPVPHTLIPSRGDARVVQLPTLAPARIVERANDGSYENGLDYAMRGRVKLVDFVEENGLRKVTFVNAGSNGAQWTGSITDAGGLFNASCDCPDKRAKWCKHLVGGALCCFPSHEATFVAVLPTDEPAPAAQAIVPVVPPAVRTPTRLNESLGPMLVYPKRTAGAGDDTPITFSMTREQYDSIVTPMCRWTPNGGQGELLKGFLNSPLIHEKIGEQWAPAASSRKTICKSVDTLVKKQPRQFDWWRGFECECPCCPAFLKVGGDFIRSDHVGDIVLTVVVEVSCQHRLSHVQKGYGRVRASDRASVALDVKRILARDGLHPSAHNSYNAMLKELESCTSDVLGPQAMAAAAAGNHSKTGTLGPRVMRQLIQDDTPDLRMDKELFSSLDSLSVTEPGIMRFQRKPFVVGRYRLNSVYP